MLVPGRALRKEEGLSVWPANGGLGLNGKLVCLGSMLRCVEEARDGLELPPPVCPHPA